MAEDKKRIKDLLQKACYKLGIIADYVVETGKSGIWTYQKWASGVVRLWGVYVGSIAAYATASFLIPSQAYPFPVYDVRDAASARVGTGGAFLAYIYDNQTAGWSGVIQSSGAIATGTSATVVAKIQIVGRWKDFEARGGVVQRLLNLIRGWKPCGCSRS